MTREEYFEIDENGILTSYKGHDENVVIPAEIRGIPVREIGKGNQVFFDAIVNDVWISAFDGVKKTRFSVAIPEGVTKINTSAFSYSSLKEVIIPKSVTEIGVGAFSGNRLTEIIIPEGVIKIGEMAFCYNPLEEIVIPESVKEIGHWAFGNKGFDDCYNSYGKKAGKYLFGGKEWILVQEEKESSAEKYFIFFKKSGMIIKYSGSETNIIIPSEIRGIPVQVIGIEAFKEKGLTNVVIPESITEISDRAFLGNKIQSIIIPENVTEIGSGAFAFNEIHSIIVPENVTKIGGGAFTGNNLTEIIIPEKVTEIRYCAFWENNLTKIIIPEGVISIEGRAFYENNLSDIVIPESVQEIYEDAFSGNPLLNIVIGSNVVLKKEQKLPWDKKSEVSVYNDFEVFYNDNGKQGGTYIFDIKANKWSIKSD